MEKAYTMAEEPYTRIYARIDLDAIVKNMEAMRENLPAKTKMIGVVKTDGYGHGAVPVAKTIASFVWGYAVATLEEGQNLRRHGIDKPILVLGSTHPRHFAELIEGDIRPAIFEEDKAELLSKLAVSMGKTAKMHIALDTGMGALASWLMITTLLSTGVVTTIIPSIAESATKTLAFDKIENPFIGILAGIIGSACYNRFKDTKLPDWLSFFSGKRCVAIVSGVVSIVVSAVLLLVWPLLFGALVAIGKSIVSLDVVGAGIYAFLNRLLIPTGLHHALNNVFWFDTIGLGDLKHFWAGETSADVTWSLGMYMSGFFPCMMFGIPGAALAMVRCAKPAKKKAAIGLVASAAVCAFICGVTEPFEFGFMFLAPVLYVIYALLYGIFTMITVALGFRAGFSFSAGAMDLLFSSSLPAAQKIWLIIPLGIAAFLVFYFVFLFAIKKWDLKTPGREDDDLEAEKKVELASDNYTAIAAKILEGCGGKENITSIDNCVTRLRLEVKDITAVNDKVIKSAGVAGVIKPGKTSVQVIVGTKVQFVADAFSKLCE